MSKISEQKALEIYPDIEINWTMMDRTKERMIYADGYDQAMQDFLEKACDYLKRNHPDVFDTYTENGYNEIEKFKEYLEV